MASDIDNNFRTVVMSTYRRRAGLESIVDLQKQAIKSAILSAADKGKYCAVFLLVDHTNNYEMKMIMWPSMVNYCIYDLRFKVSVQENETDWVPQHEFPISTRVDITVASKLVKVSGWAE